MGEFGGYRQSQPRVFLGRSELPAIGIRSYKYVICPPSCPDKTYPPALRASRTGDFAMLQNRRKRLKIAQRRRTSYRNKIRPMRNIRSSAGADFTRSPRILEIQVIATPRKRLRRVSNSQRYDMTYKIRYDTQRAKVNATRPYCDGRGMGDIAKPQI